MFPTGNILKTLVNTNLEDRNVYFNVVDPSINGVNTEMNAQSITRLLSKNKTRGTGLRFLIKYCYQCPNNILKDKAIIWLTVITRSCTTNEVCLYGEVIYEAMALLVMQIQGIPEIAKWFGSTCIGKVYESLAFLKKDINTGCTISALKAIKQCLKFYPGPSKSGKLIVMRYLLTLVDSSSPEVIYHSGNCWLLLQQVRVSPNNAGGDTDKTQWQDFQLGLLDNLNELLNKGFPVLENKNKVIKNCKLEYFNLELEADPVRRAAQVCRRFCNLIDFLNVALSEPYPSTKLISPRKILDLIQNGLELKVKNGLSNKNIDAMCFEYLLPHMHIKLCELLVVLINICHTHLRPYLRLIANIVLDSLQKTELSTPVTLRIQIYKVTMTWLSTFAEGSGCEVIAERFVKLILTDVVIRRKDIYLVSMTQPRKKCKWKNSTLSEPYSQSKALVHRNQRVLCKQALQCLQNVLDSVGFLLKLPLLRNIFTSLLESCVQIYDRRLWMENAYNDWTCRLELYKTLFRFVKLRNLTCSPPMDMVLYVLDESSKKDPSSRIRISCKLMIASVEKTLHPQRENYNFKGDSHDSTSTIQLNENIINISSRETQNTVDNNESLITGKSIQYPCRSNHSDEETSSCISEKYFKKKINSDVTGKGEENQKISTIRNLVCYQKIGIKSNVNDEDEKAVKAPILKTLEFDEETGTKSNVIGRDAKILKNTAANLQCSKSEFSSNKVKLNKCDDDDCLAELQAAFVDELK